MTMAAKTSVAGSAEESGGSVRGGVGDKNPWSHVWQVPLLVLGILAFGLGVRELIKHRKTVPFETHVADVQQILTAGEYERAIDRINVLGDFYKAGPQQAQLQKLAGDAHYLAQQKEPAFVRENYQRVADHYRKAVALGAKADAEMNERWGEAALAIGNPELAIEKLEAAIAADVKKLRPHARDLVAAYLAGGVVEKAQRILVRTLGQPDATVDERAWALCKKIELAMKAGAPAGVQEAIDDARAALKTIPERDPAGRVLLAIGHAEFDAGKLDEAQRDLSTARQRFVVHHLDDGRAAVLLGKIAEAKGDLVEAGRLYEEIATGDQGTTLWPAARFGRAEVTALKGQPDALMQADYRFVVNSLTQTDEPGSIPDATVGVSKEPELINISQVRTSYVSHIERYAGKDQLDAALVFLALQRELKDPETPATAYRLATIEERRAGELMNEVAAMPESDVKGRAEKTQAATTMLADAADAYRRHAQLTTMDDALSGNSLWRSAQLFDQSGRTKAAVDALAKFTTERPHDVRVPEGLLAMGRLYQSVGMIDDAIAIYQRNIKENARTPAAYTAAVNLARCYMVQGSEKFEPAEKTLLSLVQDNMDLGPAANEFRVSLFTLGELYYTNGRWADAILRLEEATARYPSDKAIPRALFMLGESYRKSAADIRDALQKNQMVDHQEALAAARMDRLHRAAVLFGRVIDALDVDTLQASTQETRLSPLEQEYLRTSYMDRAECYFELGEFSTAIKFYDQAATRFAQSVMAIESYVQIVNAYVLMNEKTRADAAAERAQWILKRIPDEAFSKVPAPMTRQYYEDFFKLGRTAQEQRDAIIPG